MNTVNVNGHGFAGITLQLANMRNPQNFTLYPYKGGDDIMIQSSGRCAKVNLRTGAGHINAKNQSNNGFASLIFGAIEFEMPAEALTSIKEYLWKLDGARGGSTGLVWDNKPLFSAQ